MVTRQQDAFCLTTGFFLFCILALKWFRLLNKMQPTTSILKKNYWNVGTSDSKEEEI